MSFCMDCKREFHNRSPNKTLCPQCLGRRGGKSNAWPARIKPKKAKMSKQGYLYYTLTMLTPDEKKLLPDDSRTIMVHRLVMAKYLNRPLRKGEVVMHVNGNKLDNRPENLQVGTQEENVRQHWDAYVAHEQWKRLAVVMLWAFGD